MVYLPCQPPASQNLAITFGPNTLNTSPITLPSPPLLNFNPLSKELFPLRRQTLILLTDLLSMFVLPVHRDRPSKILQSFEALHRLIQLPPSLPSSTSLQSKTRKSISVGSGRWPTTSSRLHLGKAQERLPQRTTHHFLRGVTFPTHAQHSGPTHLPTHPSRMSQITLLREMSTLFCQF